MFNKKYFARILFVSVFALCSLAVFGQENSISGKLQIKGSNDGKSPVVGAKIDCYDITAFTVASESKCSGTKTNEKGEFIVSGLKPEGKYILAASATGIGPRITFPTKVGKMDLVITVDAGDGEVLTKTEVWQAFAFAKNASGGFSEDQKLGQAVYEKRLADMTANNAKIERNNDAIKVALNDGNKAYTAKNYDLAIAKYDEGIKLAPEFLGSAPIFYNNKAAALKNRAVEVFNSAIKTKDGTAIAKGKADAKKDLSGVIEAAYKSYMILSKASPANISNKADHKKNMFNAADYARDAARIMVQIHLVDDQHIAAVKALIGAYLDIETDKAKKGKAQKVFARYLMEAYDYAAAAVEFKKALNYSGKDSDLFAFLGLSLFSTGEESQKQEALNYMSHYLKIAPKSHKMRNDISELVKELTVVQKLKPQKIK